MASLSSSRNSASPCFSMSWAQLIPVFLFDLGVAVKRDAVKLLSKARGNGALAAAGHADEHDVLHLKAQLFPDALGLAVGDVPVFKDLRRALSLRDEHVEPAHIRNAELFRLQDKRCTRGVVDDIEHTLELREERQVDRATRRSSGTCRRAWCSR